MKKILYTAAAVAALAGPALVAAPAFASSTPGGNGQTALLTGKDAATYADFGGTVVCNETQHPKFDTISCSIDPANLGLAGTSGTSGWFSDFNGQFGTLTYTVSADGSHYSGKAVYP